MAPLVLIHGGLWDDLTADRFWGRTGVLDTLGHHGVEVHTPDRLPRASSWIAEAVHLMALLPPRPLTLLGASNGCSAAVRLALARPDLVTALLLAWPATAGDPDVDASLHATLDSLGARTAEVSQLLDGQTLRGVTDAELGGLRVPVGLIPALPADRHHQRGTVDAMLARVPQARELPGCPPPPAPGFADHLPGFVGTVLGFVHDRVPGG